MGIKRNIISAGEKRGPRGRGPVTHQTRTGVKPLRTFRAHLGKGDRRSGAVKHLKTKGKAVDNNKKKSEKTSGVNWSFIHGAAAGWK